MVDKTFEEGVKAIKKTEEFLRNFSEDYNGAPPALIRRIADDLLLLIDYHEKADKNQIKNETVL